MNKSLVMKVASATAIAALAFTGISATSAMAAEGKKVYTLGGTDPFFAVVKNGFDAAAGAVKAGGSTANWLAIKDWSNAGPDMVKLTQTAISAGADVIATPVWGAAAQTPELQKVVKSGVPVVLYNTGITLVKKIGALAYIGSDEYPAGKAGGAAMAAAGSKNILCVNTMPGSINQEERCKGVIDGAKSKKAKAKQLALPSSKFGDATAIANAIKGAITADKTIDGIVTLAQGNADAARAGIDAAKSKALLGTFDLSPNGLDRIKAGKQLFAIDQQGWLQGFLSTTTAWQYSAYGLLPATTNILTGPALVTKSNVDAISAGVKTGQR